MYTTAPFYVTLGFLIWHITSFHWFNVTTVPVSVHSLTYPLHSHYIHNCTTLFHSYVSNSPLLQNIQFYLHLHEKFLWCITFALKPSPLVSACICIHRHIYTTNGRWYMYVIFATYSIHQHLSLKQSPSTRSLL